MGQTSDGIQPSSDKTEGVYYKMFLFHMLQFQLFGKYGLHQGFQLYNFWNLLLICSSKYIFSVEQIICNILQTTLKVKTMQHKVAEEQIRLQMGFNLHQTTLKVCRYNMFLFHMFHYWLFGKIVRLTTGI